MSHHIWVVLLILLVTSLLSIIIKPVIEGFVIVPSATRERCPTRNMSYDIRGDIPIKRTDMIINNSAWGPLDPERCQNKPLV
jgi:hypothetical protein